MCGSRAESSTHLPSLSASWYLSPVPKGPTFGQHHRRGFVPNIDSMFRLALRFWNTTLIEKETCSKGDTNIRELDFANLASPNKSCDFVLLPSLDCGGVPEDTVVMVQTVQVVSMPMRKGEKTKIPESPHY